MASTPPLSHDEVLGVLRALEPLADDKSIVLVGGQAVAVWTRHLAPRAPQLFGDEAVTSRDIDFEGNAEAVLEAGRLLGGEVRVAHMDDVTPNTGLVRFRDATGRTRDIDFLDAPLGLNGDDVRQTAVLMESHDPDGGTTRVWVMHPERCVESRVVNAARLGRSDAQALRVLRASIACARLWSAELLDGEHDESRQRAVLRLNERIFRRCLQDKAFRDVVLDHGIDPFDAALLDDDRLPEAFQAVRAPQMRAALTDRLAKDRRNRARAAARRA